MKIDELEWNDNNIEHIACHNVNPEEVEDICFGAHISCKEKKQRYILSGQTASGRYLNVVVEKIGKTLFRPITAFEMSDKYKYRYRKKFRK